MRRKRNLVFCSALLLLHSVAGFSQKKSCPAPPPSPFKHSGRIATSFDSTGTGGMRTTLQHPRPIGGAQNALYLTASFVHQDPRRSGKQSMEMILISSSAGAKYRNAHDVLLLCDGRPVRLASAARYQSTRADAQGMILEALKITLSRDELTSVTGARKVTARVGADEFELTNNHLEALRELASLMGGTTSRWRTE